MDKSVKRPINASISREGRATKSELQIFAARRILELLSASGGRALESAYVENTIFEEFRVAGRWHPDLDVQFGFGMSHARNAVHWARAAYTSDEITVDSKIAPGKYILACDLERLQVYYKRESELGFEEIRKRAAERKRFQDHDPQRVSREESQESNSVYIIIDRRHSGWCKIGAGRDNCTERLTEAKRWTRNEARLVQIYFVGDGYGRKVEAAAHRLLRKNSEKQLEWFRCTAEHAKHTIQEAASQVNALSLLEASTDELLDAERKATANLALAE
jgi:hypothetical protein